MIPPRGSIPLLLHCAGAQVLLSVFLPEIKALKKRLTEKNVRQKSSKRLQARLKEAETSKSLRRLMALMAPITAVVNALALYLHKLSPPTATLGRLSELYGVLLPSVYIAALLLLLTFTILCLLYICKFGFLLLRKL